MASLSVWMVSKGILIASLGILMAAWGVQMAYWAGFWKQLVLEPLPFDCRYFIGSYPTHQIRSTLPLPKPCAWGIWMVSWGIQMAS